jgi:hypothetical protein
MRMLARASLTMLCVTGAAFTAVPTAQAAAAPAADCPFAYTKSYPGPNGETTGVGWYKEGQQEGGRFCVNGHWSDTEDGTPLDMEYYSLLSPL